MFKQWQWKYHLQWDSPKEYTHLCWWFFHIWNEYDDWLFNGVHGIRIIGLNIGRIPHWIDKLMWKLLPIFRFINRRAERL